jgi:DNA-binding response OmpR family regulator
MNILYVENHAVFAETVKQRFMSPHLVKVVPSLAAARNAILNETFDLLLVDYDLDDGKGDELVRELRASGSQTIIIGVSSHLEGNTALINAGATAVCSKMEFDHIQDVFDSIKREKKTT